MRRPAFLLLLMLALVLGRGASASQPNAPSLPPSGAEGSHDYMVANASLHFDVVSTSLHSSLHETIDFSAAGGQPAPDGVLNVPTNSTFRITETDGSSKCDESGNTSAIDISWDSLDDNSPIGVRWAFSDLLNPKVCGSSASDALGFPLLGAVMNHGVTWETPPGRVLSRGQPFTVAEEASWTENKPSGSTRMTLTFSAIVVPLDPPPPASAPAPDAPCSWKVIFGAGAVGRSIEPPADQRDLGTLSAAASSAGAWEPIGKGARVGMGDTIVTNGVTPVELKSEDGWVVRIQPNSRLTLTQAVCNPTDRSSFSFKLWFGRVWSQIENAIPGNDETFHVETETGGTGVRGTEFEVEYDPSTHTQWSHAIVHSIYVRGTRGGELTVPAGQCATVAAGVDPVLQPVCREPNSPPRP